jgi:tetratricopeptide (TPR) repeat protein
LLNTGELTDGVEHFNNALRLYGLWVPKRPATLYLKLARDLPIVLLHVHLGSTGGKPVGAEQRAMFSCLHNRARAQNIIDPERNFFDNLAAMRYLSHVDPTTVDGAVGFYAATGAFFAWVGFSFGTARRCFELAAGIAREDQPTHQFLLSAMGTVVDFVSGDWGGARDMDDALLERGMRAGLLWDADVYLGFVCEREIRKGRFESARRALDQLAELSHGYGYEFAKANELAMRAFLFIEQRRLDEAREMMQAYYDFRHEDPQHLLALGGMAKLETLAGRMDAADAALSRAESIIAKPGRLTAFYLGSYATSRLTRDLAAIEAGEQPARSREVRTHLKRAVSTATKIQRELPEALRLAARVEWLQGHHARARTTWQRAITRAEQMELQPEIGRIWLDIGNSLAEQPAAGATFAETDAAGCLARAREIFVSLELGWDLEKVDAALAGIGRPADDDVRTAVAS